MKQSIIALALGFAFTWCGTASASNTSPATYGGPSLGKIDFSNAVTSLNDGEHTCRATICGEAAPTQEDAPIVKPKVVRSVDSSPCYSTYCGGR